MTNRWQPNASFETMRQRAALLRTVRRFMDDKNIMEVETPILSHSGNTDPNLMSFMALSYHPGTTDLAPLFLNTSPEFAMKRLLAAGSGSIYQISRVFRDGEAGKHHEPEFTMLEWYRVGYDHHRLMDEIIDLLTLFGYEVTECKSYADVFESCTGLNPHLADTQALHNKAIYYGLKGTQIDRRCLLDFLFSHSVTPTLTGERPVFIYDFPVCQAALARIRNDTPPVAERFELFIDGLEIANGFHELCNPVEQRARFEDENKTRKQAGLKEVPIDINLLSALEKGLPDCAGVALGLDRLLMKITNKEAISRVMTFSHDRS